MPAKRRRTQKRAKKVTALPVVEPKADNKVLISLLVLLVCVSLILFGDNPDNLSWARLTVTVIVTCWIHPLKGMIG